MKVVYTLYDKFSVLGDKLRAQLVYDINVNCNSIVKAKKDLL